MKRILVTGALGQIGSELTSELRVRYGSDNVIATDLRDECSLKLKRDGPFECVDCLDAGRLSEVVGKYNIDCIYHLAALLSAVAENRPQIAWNVNINGLIDVLETARAAGCSLFVPSSIGAFGPGTPHDGTPQDTIQRPSTMYGVTKVTGELLCDYYHSRFGVDTRGVRFPGLISNVTLPGGGTTDYAVEIFYEAIKKGRYTCYLEPDTRLDMMYMPDALRAAVEIMEADPARLKHRNAFNVAAMSFTPAELAAEITRHLPGFTIEYQVDPLRQAIADSWPDRLDDSAAKSEWGWCPNFNLPRMTADMLKVLAGRVSRGEL
jgi:nucleoside-diphosphate-sugar epimerase